MITRPRSPGHCLMSAPGVQLTSPPPRIAHHANETGQAGRKTQQVNLSKVRQAGYPGSFTQMYQFSDECSILIV